MDYVGLKMETTLLEVCKRDAKLQGRSLSGHLRFLIKKGMGFETEVH